MNQDIGRAEISTFLCDDGGIVRPLSKGVRLIKTEAKADAALEEFIGPL
jgi:hypothetical protein